MKSKDWYKKNRRSYVEDENGNIQQVPRIYKGQRTSLTRIHRQLVRMCNDLGLEIVIEKKFGPYEIDVYIPKYRIGLESDGAYWHTLPGRKEKDQKRDKFLKDEFLIDIYRFTDVELSTQAKIVMAKIKEITINKDT